MSLLLAPSPRLDAGLPSRPIGEGVPACGFAAVIPGTVGVENGLNEAAPRAGREGSGAVGACAAAGLGIASGFAGAPCSPAGGVLDAAAPFERRGGKMGGFPGAALFSRVGSSASGITICGRGIGLVGVPELGAAAPPSASLLGAAPPCFADSSARRTAGEKGRVRGRLRACPSARAAWSRSPERGAK